MADESIDEFYVKILKATEKALLCRFGEQEEWIPKSQIVDAGTEVASVGDEGPLVIPRWLAKAKKLIA